MRELAPAPAVAVAVAVLTWLSSIIADPKNPALYTNRALARLKLSQWNDVVYDCRTCLDLAPDNMKAYYYLSQAELSLREFDAAVQHCQQAQTLCAQTEDKSITNITNHLLACKKARWQDKERLRLRQSRPLENEVVELLEAKRDEDLAALDGEDRAEAEADWAKKISELRSTFELSRCWNEKHREVPDWLVDDITFEILTDPVMTKTGKSYERAAILEHLRRSPTDPLTREPLQASDLRTNLTLRQACEDFLEENGWAYDW